MNIESKQSWSHFKLVCKDGMFIDSEFLWVYKS